MIPLTVASFVLGLISIGVVLQDAFEVVLLPRPVRRRIRLMRYFFRATWSFWVRIGRCFPPGSRRESVLGVYGPLSMVLLFAVWAAGIIAGFALLQWTLSSLHVMGRSPLSFSQCLLTSGDAFFTLGYGDIVLNSATARATTIIEAGTGFGFIALTISYLPVLHQHFCQRDVQIIQLAARAGSPPTAIALMLRQRPNDNLSSLNMWLRDWELWAAELIESHSSYPMLAFYRSQHENHSWLASLAVVLDCCALVLAGFEGESFIQAENTFLVARRVLIEMCQALDLGPPLNSSCGTCFPMDHFSRLSRALAQSGYAWISSPETEASVSALWETYNPMLSQLSTFLLLSRPGWLPSNELELQTAADRLAAIRRLIEAE